MEGKNTFGCLVNGGAWVTRVSTDVLAFYQSGVLQVSASVDNSSIDLIVLNGLTQGATYDLTNTPSHAATFSWVRPSGICFYEEENTLIGEFNVTKLDQSKLIISGSFEFTTVTPVCDTIKVTNGRFDVLYAN
jgi:hypothetical protein